MLGLCYQFQCISSFTIPSPFQGAICKKPSEQGGIMKILGMTFPISRVTSPGSWTCFSGRDWWLSDLDQDNSITSLSFIFLTYERGITVLTCRVVVKNSKKYTMCIVHYLENSWLSGNQQGRGRFFVAPSLTSLGLSRFLPLSWLPALVPCLLTPPMRIPRLLTEGPLNPGGCQHVCRNPRMNTALHCGPSSILLRRKSIVTSLCRGHNAHKILRYSMRTH